LIKRERINKKDRRKKGSKKRNKNRKGKLRVKRDLESLPSFVFIYAF